MSRGNGIRNPITIPGRVVKDLEKTKLRCLPAIFFQVIQGRAQYIMFLMDCSIINDRYVKCKIIINHSEYLKLVLKAHTHRAVFYTRSVLE